MINIRDRIKELTYVTSTGNITLSGAVRGFSTFSSAYNNNESLFYAITDGLNYEIGSGLYYSSTNQIKRFVIKSTNSNNLVNFSEGAKEVYVTYPATNAVFNTSGINPFPQNSGIAFWTSSNSLSYSNKFVIDSGNGRIGINKNGPLYAIDIGGLAPNSIIRSSGLIIGSSGISFPSGNNGTSSYSGGIQLVHFIPNQLSSSLSTVLELSGIVNQNILLKKQNAGMVFAGPSGGCTPPCDPSYPTFRFLSKDDIPQEISNLAIGDEDSSTFLTINLPNGLPDNVYRDINAISINNGDNVFSVNGLGEIEFATISMSQVVDLDDTIALASGSLNSRIVTVSGISVGSSGALNNKIDTVSGIFNAQISSINVNVSTLSNVCNGRLSLSSTDSSYSGSGTTMYFVPHNGNSISLYNGSSWTNINFSSKTVSLFSSLSPNTIYDVFGYLNNNDISFQLVSWTMYDPSYPNLEEPEINPWNSYRTNALSKIDGVYCKSGDNTRRYLGTIRTGASAFLDNESNRFVCNAYNKIKKYIYSDVNPINDEPYFTFSWIYSSSDVRKIPYIPEISVINGLDSNIDLKIVLDASIPYTRSEYILGIIRSQEIFYHQSSESYGNILDYIDNADNLDYYGSIVLSNTSGFANADIIGGDYQDGIYKTLTSSISCKPVGYEKYYGIEKARLGTPIVYGNRLTGNYGIMGTYEC